MQRYPYHVVPMDPQVCPPPLSSSQSLISGLDKSPVSTFKPGHSRNSSTGSSKHSKQSRNWEVMEDLHQLNESSVPGSTLDLSIPGICEGVLMKRRKYPLKGWHKRYFLLEKGILKYSKTLQDIQRGKLHGSLDVSLAVMSINKKSKRIDLDSGDNLYHLKESRRHVDTASMANCAQAKSHDLFYIWLTKLVAHRVFKKNEAMSVHHGILNALSLAPSSLSIAQKNHTMLPHYASSASVYQTEMTSPPPPAVASHPGVTSKVSAWLQQTHDIDATSNDLARCQTELTELAHLIQRLLWLEGGLPLTSTDLEKRISMQNLSLDKPKRKSGKVFGHSRTLSRVEAMGGVFTSNHLSANSSSGLAASVASIPDYVYSQLSSPQVPSPEAKKLHQEICTASQKVHASLKSIHEVLTLERERVRQAWTAPDLRQNTSQQLATLCSTMSELDLQSRLTKVHSLSLSSESSEESFCTVRPDQTPSLGRHSTRAPSVADSMAEYFDASEGIMCESSSEAEASDESGLSDTTTTSNSEPDERHATATLNYRASLNSATDKPSPVPSNTGHRMALPAPGADNSHIGIMTILYNNIGKDLSRVSMPVALNEPLCLLQRLSEELEYTKLLDIANQTDDPYDRMVYVAAFSISGYAWASWRYRYKPFNPVLGETYESHREDRGFHYISEQVSHHPPISACHAESESFTFWQDQRWKNKFWGKSVEIISSGPVNVTLRRYGDHYEWNKAVTCIHNVLSQQRWLEHYGEVVIKNKQSDVCTCKITFVKSNYWSSDGKNEVQGVVLNRAGEVVRRFGGFWHEGIFLDTQLTPTCIWKPNVQPEDHPSYYGFSHYARELNELNPDLEAVLPATDTRFRPDQRLLEEGKVAEADKKKDEVEEKQRERRKEMAKRGEEHVPRFFSKALNEDGREVWLYNETYWNLRKDPGFANTSTLDLW